MRDLRGILFLFIFFGGVGIVYVIVDIHKKRIRKRATQKNTAFRYGRGGGVNRRC